MVFFVFLFVFIFPPIWPKPSCRYSKRGKKTRQTEEEVGRKHYGLDRPGVRQVLEGSWEYGKNGGNWFWNHLTTLAIRGIDDEMIIYNPSKSKQILLRLQLWTNFFFLFVVLWCLLFLSDMTLFGWLDIKCHQWICPAIMFCKHIPAVYIICFLYIMYQENIIHHNALRGHYSS